MIKFLKNLSLRKKLISIILFITLSSLIIALATLFSYNQKNLKSRMARELLIFANVIGDNMSNTIFYTDNNAAQNLLQTLSSNKNIEAAFILTSNNDVFVKYLKNNKEIKIQVPNNLENNFRFTKDYLEVLKNFYEDDEIIFKVYIISNLNELNNQGKIFLELTIFVLLIAFLYASIASFLLNKPLVKPILDLVELTKDVTEFRDYTIRIENKYGTNEIGVLCKGFNEMLEQIEDQSNNIIQAFTEISHQKKEIEGQKNKIDIQSKELQKTYSELEQYMREVTESIRYAKKIQESTLPQITTIQKDLPNSFILYKPRDIVSGDFYWYANIYDKVYIAAADCTGHGVPGTLLSIIGNSLLNQIIHDYGIFKPSEILDYLDKGMRQIFQTKIDNNEDQMEGMDIALVMIDLDEEILEYAGAINPLYLVRDDEIMQIKADPFSIVSLLNFEGKPYTNHVIPIQKFDTIYIFSDGYTDQIGGPEMRKIKKVGLRELLIEVNDKDMDEQEEFFDNYFENWKKDFDQVDDVLLIGIRV